MLGNIKTINQQYKQLKQSKQQLVSLIKDLSIEDISADQDLQQKHITIQKLFDRIPNEETLIKHATQATNNKINSVLQDYHGQYQLVRKIALKKDQLKPQTESVYYTFASLNLPKIDNSFYEMKQRTEVLSEKNQQGQNQILKLKSYQIMRNKMLKATKYQKNTRNPAYFSQLKQTQDNEILSEHQYLQEDDLLINICLNDSINDQKIFQYVCLGEMKLNQLKNSFYCLIQKICSEQGEKINPKKKEKLKNENIQNSFFLIQDNFYYHGNSKVQDEIDEIIKKIESISSQKYRKFQMNHTQLKDLRVIFGRPYLFRHLGGCDHSIVFKDLRLFSQNLCPKNFYYNDEEKKTKYPVIVYESKMKQRKCQGCEVKYAKLATFPDILKKGNISYLCKECHSNIHNQKTNQNNKIKKSIPYIHD